ncbi:MAG: hypothetical protein OXB98_11300 [Bryobacterales bacterium]|nr:hypothetical protein [Bryobacterales bacterium]
MTVGGRPPVNGSNLLEARNWNRTKENWIITKGFSLDDAKLIELKHECRFEEYTGKGNRPFDLTLSIVWKLGGEEFRREIAVDDRPIPDLQISCRYVDLGSRSSNVDRLCADALREVSAEIERRSGK